MSFSVGDSVYARYRGFQRFYPGVISSRGEDGSYGVDYADDDYESGVPAEYIEPREIQTHNSDSTRRECLLNVPGLPSELDLLADTIRADLYAGMRITARYNGSRRQYPGMLRAINDDGTYCIAFDDGDAVAAAPLRDISLAGDSAVIAVVGTAVMAKDHNTFKYYPGFVNKVNADGTCDIHFIGHDKGAVGLRRQWIQIRKPTNRLHEVYVGAVVRGRYRGGRAAYPGIISAINTDGTYNIDYYDGDRESFVEADAIHLQDISSGIKLGVRVWARYKSSEKYYPGLIVGLQELKSKTVYSVRFDDGTFDALVKMCNIELNNPLSRSRDCPLNVGVRVWSRWKEGRREYPGVITRLNGDDTYDIVYDDGECEGSVKPEFVSILTEEDDTSVSPGPPAEQSDDLYVGARVSVNHTKDEDSKAGVVVWIHNNDTYDIDFPDNSTLKRVARDSIDLLATNDASSPIQSFVCEVEPKERKADVIDSTSISGDDLCCVCLQASKGAALLHGNTSHFACCYSCSMSLKNNKIACPICRLHIDAVIKCFTA